MGADRSWAQTVLIIWAPNNSGQRRGRRSIVLSQMLDAIVGAIFSANEYSFGHRQSVLMVLDAVVTVAECRGRPFFLGADSWSS